MGKEFEQPTTEGSTPESKEEELPFIELKPEDVIVEPAETEKEAGEYRTMSEKFERLKNMAGEEAEDEIARKESEREKKAFLKEVVEQAVHEDRKLSSEILKIGVAEAGPKEKNVFNKGLEHVTETLAKGDSGRRLETLLSSEQESGVDAVKALIRGLYYSDAEKQQKEQAQKRGERVKIYDSKIEELRHASEQRKRLHEGRLPSTAAELTPEGRKEAVARAVKKALAPEDRRKLEYGSKERVRARLVGKKISEAMTAEDLERLKKSAPRTEKPTAKKQKPGLLKRWLGGKKAA